MTADADPPAERREADHMVREILEEPTGSVDVLPLSEVLSAIERLEKWVDRRGRLLSSFVPKRATALMSAPTGRLSTGSRAMVASAMANVRITQIPSSLHISTSSRRFGGMHDWSSCRLNARPLWEKVGRLSLGSRWGFVRGIIVS